MKTYNGYSALGRMKEKKVEEQILVIRMELISTSKFRGPYDYTVIKLYS